MFINYSQSVMEQYREIDNYNADKAGFEKAKSIYSGSNIFVKTWSHYQTGKRQDFHVSSNALDFSFVSKRNLTYNKKSNTYSVDLFKLNKYSQTSLALGKVSMKYLGNNQYSLDDDLYDFNIEWSQSINNRNVATLAAGIIHGPVIDNIPIPILVSGVPVFGPSVYLNSGPYNIKFHGSVYIKP